MIFLRFPDKQTFEAVVGPLQDQWRNPELDNLDVIGVIVRPGSYDEVGNVIVAPVVLEGFHANFAGDLHAEMEPYVIPPPARPYRVFAGYKPQP